MGSTSLALPCSSMLLFVFPLCMLPGSLCSQDLFEPSVAHFMQLLSEHFEALGGLPLFCPVERLDLVKLLVKIGKELGLAEIKLLVSFERNITTLRRL